MSKNSDEDKIKEKEYKKAFMNYFYIQYAFQNIFIDDVDKRGYINYKMKIKELEEMDLTHSIYYSNLLSNNNTRVKKDDDCATRINKISRYVEKNSLDNIKSKQFKYEDYCVIYRAIGFNSLTKITEHFIDSFINDREKNNIRRNDEFIINTDLVKLVHISSLNSFIKEINKLKNDKDKTLLYRGHENILYNDIPSLFRNKIFEENEFNLCQEIVIRCSDFFVNCNSHLDFLTEMQHYGIPTRLLDLTSNPLIALYFACENKKKTGEVLCYSVEQSKIKYSVDYDVILYSCFPFLQYNDLKEIKESFPNCKATNILKDEFKIEKYNWNDHKKLQDLQDVKFVKPKYKNKRIQNQNGLFALFGLGEESKALDKYRYKENELKVIFYIRESEKNKILNSLQNIGIHKAFIYPEIDDVASYLKDYYLDSFKNVS